MKILSRLFIVMVDFFYLWCGVAILQSDIKTESGVFIYVFILLTILPLFNVICFQGS